MSLSRAVGQETTAAFQETKNLSRAMGNEMTVGFQEMENDRDSIKGTMDHSKISSCLLILCINTVEKINQWLDAPLPSSNHSIAMKKRQPNTGEWFTKSIEFAQWKTEARSLIWLHGIRKS